MGTGLTTIDQAGAATKRRANAAKPPRRRGPAALTELRKALPADVEERLKAIACHLFARRGIDGVTVREIIGTAKVRNFGAVGYYFGSKDNLVRQILIDGARAIDARRAELLDRLESSNEDFGILDIVEVLIHAVVDLPAIQHRNFIGFALMVSMTHRELYVATMFGQRTPAFDRCIAHLRRLMPPIPVTAAQRRLMFVKTGMGAVLARREHVLATRGKHFDDWRSDETLRDYARSLTVMLEAHAEPDD